MRLGFTGTREGMSPEQMDVVEPWIIDNANNFVEVHHGDCIGADAEFDELILRYCPDLIRDIHPPLKAKYRAWCQIGKARVHKPKDYYARNRDIVDASTWLIATPQSYEQHGGTWYTVNYGREQKVNGNRMREGKRLTIMIVHREGQVVIQ